MQLAPDPKVSQMSPNVCHVSPMMIRLWWRRVAGALSTEGPFQRDVVERWMRETLHLVLRAAATRPSVSHTFPGIRVLSFRESWVKMLFCRDFISTLDGTGKLSSALASVSHSEWDFSVFEPGGSCLIRLCWFADTGVEELWRIWETLQCVMNCDLQRRHASHNICRRSSEKTAADWWRWWWWMG